MGIDLSWQGKAASRDAAAVAMNRVLDEARTLGLRRYRVTWAYHGDVLVPSDEPAQDEAERRDIVMVGIQVAVHDTADLCLGFDATRTPLPIVWVLGDLCCVHEASEVGWQPDCIYCQGLGRERPLQPPRVLDHGFSVRTTRAGTVAHAQCCSLLDVLRREEGIELEVHDDTGYWDGRDFAELAAAFDEHGQACEMIAAHVAQGGGTVVGHQGVVGADQDEVLRYLTSESLAGGLGWRCPPGWVAVADHD